MSLTALPRPVPCFPVSVARLLAGLTIWGQWLALVRTRHTTKLESGAAFSWYGISRGSRRFSGQAAAPTFPRGKTYCWRWPLDGAPRPLFRSCLWVRGTWPTREWTWGEEAQALVKQKDWVRITIARSSGTVTGDTAAILIVIMSDERVEQVSREKERGTAGCRAANVFRPTSRIYVFDVTSVGQRSSPWLCNSVKVEIKFHLECKLRFPRARLLFYDKCI